MTLALRRCMAMMAGLHGSCRGAQRTFDGLSVLVRSAERGLGAIHRRTKARPPEVLRRARRQVQRRPHPDPEPE